MRWSPAGGARSLRGEASNAAPSLVPRVVHYGRKKEVSAGGCGSYNSITNRPVSLYGMNNAVLIQLLANGSMRKCSLPEYNFYRRGYWDRTGNFNPRDSFPPAGSLKDRQRCKARIVRTSQAEIVRQLPSCQANAH